MSDEQARLLDWLRIFEGCGDCTKRYLSSNFGGNLSKVNWIALNHLPVPDGVVSVSNKLL